ncbi:MAG: hypothetical protein JSS75_08645 [Bacteroidetes bacterium]|nr:hypothetical protein [Bacteroidota bacterium]
MEHTTEITDERWSLAHRVGFRFFAAFVVLSTTIWYNIPFTSGWLLSSLNTAIFWLGSPLLDFFGIGEPDISTAGAGDVHATLARTVLNLFFAALISLCWSFLDRKRASYVHLRYYLRLLVRLDLSMMMMWYGIVKVLCLQMPAPTLATLAMPFGEQSRMQLAWNFVGSSATYQQFSGILEVLAGLLLLYRRTSIIGAFVAAGVLANVVMMNFCYGIPVKYYSSYLFILALYVLSEVALPLWHMIVQRNAYADTKAYQPQIRIWLRGAWVVIICYAVWETLGATVFASPHDPRMLRSLHPALYGNYKVISFEVNGVPMNDVRDEQRWNQLVVGESLDSAKFDGMLRVGFDDVRPFLLQPTSDRECVMNFERPMYESYSVRIIRHDSTSAELLARKEQLEFRLLLRKSDHQYKLEQEQFRWNFDW